MVIISIAVLPSCRRAPEGPPDGTPVTDSSDVSQIKLDALDLPLENPQIKISVSKTPPGLVATYNGEASIELADEKRPNLRYTFDADFPDQPSRSPKTVEEFEQFIGKHHDGSLTDNGTMDTVLGAATWASGTYFEEDQSFGDVRLFVPHPTQTGTLILSAVCPVEESTVEERLATMNEILTHVS
jgi:hypothetical protein